MIYRLAETADWLQAQQTGFFASNDLTTEGFIHTSDLPQVLETARRYYAGHPNLILLELDDKQLIAAGVRVEREWVATRQATFAHVFGPVPLPAVVRHWPLLADAAGDFSLPPQLLGQ
ncbi:DUF952 domain-containing protein [Hymenobacter metallicola]|nr:DUF952 domain-containing protein [Hymenobacter metallicola]